MSSTNDESAVAPDDQGLSADTASNDANGPFDTDGESPRERAQKEADWSDWISDDIDLSDLESSLDADDLATKESQVFADEKDLEKISKNNEHRHTESLRELVFQAAKALFGLLACLVEVALIFWAWHLILPKEFGFLDQSQLDRIQTILTTIVFSGLVGGYARKVMNSGQK